MRETAAAARLEAEADLIVNADGDKGRGMVGRDDDSQAVGEFRVLDRNMQLLQLLPPVDFLVRASTASTRRRNSSTEPGWQVALELHALH